jgi:hypothetical protein
MLGNPGMVHGFSCSSGTTLKRVTLGYNKLCTKSFASLNIVSHSGEGYSTLAVFTRRTISTSFPLEKGANPQRIMCAMTPIDQISHLQVYESLNTSGATYVIGRICYNSLLWECTGKRR